MTRVHLVCGSLQRGSANQAALDVARTCLSACGLHTDAFESLASVPPLDPARQDDPGAAVTGWRAQLRAADAVLIAAPEYAGALAGVVKNALDWLVGSGELYGKPIALLSAGTTGGVLARRDLVRTLCWQGAHVVASAGIVAPKAKSEALADGSRRFTDAATLAEIEAVVASLVASIAQLPVERLPAMQRLAVDAGIDPAPLAERVGGRSTALRERGELVDEVSAVTASDEPR